MFFNKRGILIGFAIAVLLVAYHMFPMTAQYRCEMLSSTLGLSMILGEIFGGAMSGFIIGKYLSAPFTKSGKIWGGIIGSILISPMAFVTGVASGTMSIGLGTMAGSLIGMRQVGIYGVLFIVIILVIILVECAGAGIGAFLGSFTQSLFQRLFHHTKK